MSTISSQRKLSGKSLPDYGSLPDIEKNTNEINDGIVINNITKANNADLDSVAISITVPVCGEDVNCDGANFAAQDLVRIKLMAEFCQKYVLCLILPKVSHFVQILPE